jgi:hypothetical protein
MRTTATRLAGAALGVLAAGALMAAASGITTRQARTAAPSTQTLSSSSNAEGSSLSFARADHQHGFTGTAPAAADVLCSGACVSDGELVSAYSGVGACAANQAATSLSRNAAPTCSTFWNAGNDGAGSGLDADLLDGLSSVHFGGGSYDIATFYPGKPPGSSGLMVRLAITRATRLPAGLTGTVAFSGVNATSSTAITIQKRTAGGTTTTIGTLTWSNASTAATVSFTSNVDFAGGDFLELVGPTTQDATLADLSVTFVATRL